MTFLKRCNPVALLLASLIVTLPLITTVDWLIPSLALGASLVGLLLAGLPPKTLRLTIPLVLLAPLAGLSMALYGRPGGHIYFTWLAMVVSEQSLWLALGMVVRVLAVSIPVVLVVSQLDPTDVADGLSQVLKLPARFVLGSLAGLRTIGRAQADWRTLAHARRARGLGDAWFGKRWFSKAFGLLVLSLRRGSTLATAMEARGFGGAGTKYRTWARPSMLTWRDGIVLGVAVIVIVVAFAVGILCGTFTAVWS